MRPDLEIADIVRRFGKEYIEKYGPSTEKMKVLFDILQCRTLALGGHEERWLYTLWRRKRCCLRVAFLGAKPVAAPTYSLYCSGSGILAQRRMGTYWHLR